MVPLDCIRGLILRASVTLATEFMNLLGIKGIGVVREENGISELEISGNRLYSYRLARKKYEFPAQPERKQRDISPSL